MVNGEHQRRRLDEAVRREAARRQAVHDLEDQAREVQAEAYKRLHRGEQADEPEQQ
jgi:hypothetical protein